MDKETKKKLQKMINRTTKASAAFFQAQTELNDWCREYYGHEAGDIDADEIIDSVFGGCGMNEQTMKAEDFDRIMREG